MKLSKSRIACLCQCPYKYKVIYEDGWKSEKTSKQLDEGKEKHEIFERVVKKAKAYHAKTSDLKKKVTFKEVLEIIKAEVKAESKYEKYKEDCDNFIRFQERIERLPIYEEVELFDPELNIIGILDRVDFTPEGLIIIDYKTGKGKDSIASYRFELALYAYLFEKLHNQKIAGWAIYFTSKDKMLMEGRSQEEINKAIEKVSLARKDITEHREKGVWEKKTGPLCGWCDLYQAGMCNGEDDFFFGKEND